MISRTDILLVRAELRALLHRIRGRITFYAGILKNIENPWDALAVRLHIRKNAYLRFRGKKISVLVPKNDFSSYVNITNIFASRKIHYLGQGRFSFSHSRGLEFNCSEKMHASFASCASEMECYYDLQNNVVCEVSGLKFIMPFPHGAFELREIFIEKQYGEPYCNNAVVVDVGAFIGDSSLFFASRGAKLVIAFEPIPILFNILKKNIRLNRFENTVMARNEAISDRVHRARIGYVPKAPGSSGGNSAENQLFFEVDSTSLSEVIATLGHIDILKMDCEGCEHKALHHAAKNGALEYVGMIIMEIHSEVPSIIKLLKGEGFKVNGLTKPMYNRWVISAQRHEQ